MKNQCQVENFILFYCVSVKREREENLDSHSCGVYLQLRKYIYIYKARSPNYHTCDLY